ncbi:hypothetical protein ACFFV7_03265 [Nonomuraea spiralis]|uniref:RDD family protein n=1 Tax=Nonomuraea spiralis TaxID=46182 RepID=A0ABV5I6P5_9ACTN|nr:hypothetical protein [Nonomuraea spiralis]GGS66597.1 hypothetical protein GCM10010176_006540 [Nonomuraea spiralis]
MNDDLHPLSRREGPTEADEPSEPERPLIPLDASLPDVCASRPACLARHVRSEGGMSRLLRGLAVEWGLYGLVWAAGIWLLGPYALAIATALTLPPVLVSLVLHRRWGHRGRCWVLRSLDPDTIVMVLARLLAPFRWLEPAFWVVVWPFRRVLRFFAWIGRLLSALGDL